MNRLGEIVRETKETQIKLTLDLDGSGSSIHTGVGFFDHMLEQIAKHGALGLTIEAKGDTHIDAHHLVEDTGIALGSALKMALGDKKGIVRFGHSYVPLDEALSRVVIDCSGRPGLFFRCTFTRPYLGEMDTELVREFFQGLVNAAGITLHIDNLEGFNAHHQAESIFKAFGRALRMAVSQDERSTGIPSTKGTL
ncbi:MAG: imidazoleglycerol-phosphate dehydratase HisB [Sutterella sp.]|nr:imidazoleglycerol-phosphate dehydratase HisB [Sutterella sp.]